MCVNVHYCSITFCIIYKNLTFHSFINLPSMEEWKINHPFSQPDFFQLDETRSHCQKFGQMTIICMLGAIQALSHNNTLPDIIDVHRNPVHPSRPSFSTICSRYLKQSSSSILYWAPEDEVLSPAVGVSGAPLEEAHKLYLDLQEKYKNSNFKV